MGTRGGRPEPQAVAARPVRGKGQPGKAQPGKAQPGAMRKAQRGQEAGSFPGSARTARPEPAIRGTGPGAAGAAGAQDGPVGPPRWFQYTTLGLSLAGLAVSAYLTVAHYTESALAACPENTTVNCAKVTTSPESMVWIFPVAVLGLVFYLFMTAATTPWAWRARPGADHPAGERARWAGRAAAVAAAALPWARLGGVIVGIGFVLYLIYAELFLVDAICLWCTSVHVLTFLLFGLIVASAATWGPRGASR
jgi:uncharacterized membrane protein